MSILSVKNDLLGASFSTAQIPVPPTITGYSISGLDDTALLPEGGQTVVINGTGFKRGATITFDGVAVPVVSWISTNSLSFTSPAKPAGTYTIYVVNPDGGTGIFIPGVIYSTAPTWTTAAGSLGTVYETQNIATTVEASGDVPVTYQLYSGTLPPGSVLSSAGVLSGTAPVESGSTTYTFTIEAIDNELQSSIRTFSLTINTDVVTWVNPAPSATILIDGAAHSTTLSATSAAGYTVEYAANSLPNGLSLVNGVISGVATTEGSTTTTLTATAATTNRSATNTITWVVSLGDPNWSYVTTLLSPQLPVAPFNRDASTNNFAVTVNGDTRPNNFNPYTPGYYSNYFDGSGDYLTLSSAANTAMSFGTGDFTVECWANFNSFGGANYAPIFGNAYLFYVGSTGKVLLYNGSADVVSGNANDIPSLNTWHHIAWVRSGTTVTIYVNGISKATGTVSASINNGSVYAGAVGVNSTVYFSGSISNLRVVKGTAVYTANFTPPTAPLTAISGTSLLTCQSNTFVDNSTNNFTITRAGDTQISGFGPYTPNSSYSGYGSTYFDGTGDYLQLPSSSQFNLGAGDFTIEMWVNLDVTNIQGQYFFESSSFNPNMFLWNNGVIYLRTAETSGEIVTPTASGIVAGSWTHIACVRSGNTYSIYINGSLLVSGTSTGVTNVDKTLSFGRNLKGYISNFRVVKGTALYTANFAPPAAPLTAITNTSLLTCQTNQPANNNVFIDNSTNNLLVTRAGNATQGTFSPYGENWSNYFDGTGDYLTVPTSTSLDFGTGDFTVEAWVFPTSLSSDWFITSATGSGGLFVGFSSSGTTGFGWGRNAVAWDYRVASTATLGTWQHVAVTRSGTSMRLFVNGVQQGTTQTLSTTYNLGATSTTIGSQGAAYYLTGNISNLRVVKGTSLYTSNFTPSTTPLQAVSGTSLLTCQSPNIVDKSANNFTITRNGDVSVQKFGPFAGTTLPTPHYSAYFDGSGDYLTVPSNSNWSFAGQFTVEGWFYWNVTPASGNMFGVQSNGGFCLYNTGTELNPNIYGTGNIFNSGFLPATGTWYHIAITRNSSNLMTMWVNGVSVGSATTSSSYTTGTYTVGSASGTNVLQGYISNFRIVNGTALYTSNFTPPTTPLTAIANTSLLTCQSNTFIDNSTNNFAITAVGNSKPTTFSPFSVTYNTKQSYTPSVYGGSMRFDGTGDYVTVSTLTPATALSSGNWTFECWFYASATKTFAQIIGNRSGASGSTAYVPIVVTYESATIKLYSSSNGSSWNLVNGGTIGTVTLQSWNHVAVVRNGNNLEAYLNGIKVTLSTGLSGISYTATNLFYASGANDPFAGYVSDVRLVSGIALYTSNFVPQNRPATPVTNTTLLLNGTSGAVIDSSTLNNLETVGDARLSTQVVKYGNTSMRFDGSGDSLSVIDNPNINLGSGDFTIELWVYFNAVNAQMTLINKGWNSSSAYASYLIWMQNDGTLRFLASSNGSSWDIANEKQIGSVTAGQWYHVAVTRSGTTFRAFVNGVINNSFTFTSSASLANIAAQTLFIGDRTNGGTSLNGYMQDVRITKGYARYTTNFTPPTTLLQNK